MQTSVCRPFAVDEYPLQTVAARTPRTGDVTPFGEAQPPFESATIVGQSPAMRRVIEQIQQVAATDSTVLLLGETGTGKELLATHIHELSNRRERMMVRVN